MRECRKCKGLPAVKTTTVRGTEFLACPCGATVVRRTALRLSGDRQRLGRTRCERLKDSLRPKIGGHAGDALRRRTKRD